MRINRYLALPGKPPTLSKLLLGTALGWAFLAGTACGPAAESPEDAQAKERAEMNSPAKFTNRLIQEQSPYLLQHAHNPVDWYPWGEKAFTRAREEDKPVFLSVGYSTCHWCHVMEEESFENQRIAQFLNEHFVAIKVDREERPDVDQLYMSAVQALTGRGGWPMSVFLTPEGEPFFGGTYFPPDDRHGRPGFRSLLERIQSAWETDRGQVVNSAQQMTALLREANQAPAAGGTAADGGSNLLAAAFGQLRDRFDDQQGGFGAAPKFPTPHNLTFLLRYANRTGDETALNMVRTTLDRMAAGGIYDHLGGGFHRYSTDARWLVPHFEKMLYDQAGLTLAYTDAFLVTGDDRYAEVVRGILEYVLRDLRDEGGGFYSAEDADSEGEEGTFYVWTAREIEEALDPDIARGVMDEYDVTQGGNWEGHSILNRRDIRRTVSPEVKSALKTLFDIREKRERPHRDEKIIAAWNGYMIEALARAGRALGEARYIQAAEDASRFIREHLWDDGRLQRYHRGGARTAAYVDDYAFLGRGELALYETTFDPAHLAEAKRIAEEMIGLFHQDEGSFVMAGHDAEQLIAPVVESYDGAMPSGNSAAAVFLLRLGHLLGDRSLEQKGRDVLSAFARNTLRSPSAHLELLSGLDFVLGPISEIVIAGDPSGLETDSALRDLLRVVWRGYHPNSVVAFHPTSGEGPVLELIPYLSVQGVIDGKATAYVCQDYACQLPVHDAAGLVEQLAGSRGQ